MVQVTIEIPEDQRPADFDKMLARFQRHMDGVERDVRDKARVCIHEGGHAMQNRRYGGEVEFFGPSIQYDGKKALGSVSPKGELSFGPFEWAAIWMAGPFAVEQVTGTPDDPETVNHDLECLKRWLGTTDGRYELAKNMGEFALLSDMQKPDFLPLLEASVRDYERAVYGTDEVWDFAVKDFHLDSFRERVAVGNNSLGYLMWLIPDGEKVRLFLHGQERSPAEKIYGIALEAYSVTPGERAADAVRRWNEMVRAVEGNMTNEQIEALRKKWEQHDGKTVDVSDVKEGFDIGEFVESLRYSKTPEEKSST